MVLVIVFQRFEKDNKVCNTIFINSGQWKGRKRHQTHLDHLNEQGETAGKHFFGGCRVTLMGRLRLNGEQGIIKMLPNTAHIIVGVTYPIQIVWPMAIFIYQQIL